MRAQLQTIRRLGAQLSERMRFRELGPQALLGICLVAAVAGAILLAQLTSQLPAAGSPPELTRLPVLQGAATGPIPPPGVNILGRPSLPVGTLAPDFTLADVAGGPAGHLASFRGRTPVVLIFGSFSCNVLCAQAEQIRQLHEEHQHHAQFLFVSITEACHRIPELTSLYADAGLSREDPADRLQRIELARKHYGLTMPILLDTADHSVEHAYDAFPKRLVVIDRDGRIAYDAGPGLSWSWNFDAIGECLNEQAGPSSSPSKAGGAAGEPRP